MILCKAERKQVESSADYDIDSAKVLGRNLMFLKQWSERLEQIPAHKPGINGVTTITNDCRQSRNGTALQAGIIKRICGTRLMGIPIPLP